MILDYLRNCQFTTFFLSNNANSVGLTGNAYVYSKITHRPNKYLNTFLKMVVLTAY